MSEGETGGERMTVRTTPFHERLSELNTQGLYTHWQGYLSPLRYTHAPKHEYFAVRNSVGVFDTSPLYKYRITGPDSERFLAFYRVLNPEKLRHAAGSGHNAAATPSLQYTPVDPATRTTARPSTSTAGPRGSAGEERI